MNWKGNIKMSERSLDTHGRWRSKTIAFRISPEDNEQINRLVALSGMSKQDYIAANMMRHRFTVYPNSRVQKAMKYYLQKVILELQRIEKAGELTDEFLQVLRFALQIFEGLGGTTPGR